MFPILVHLGPLTVRTYGAMVALAFLASLQMARVAARARRIGEAFLLDLVALLIVTGLLGARLLYLLVNLNYFRDHPWESFKVWEGGLVFYGGLLLAALVGIVYMVSRLCGRRSRGLPGSRVSIRTGHWPLGLFFCRLLLWEADVSPLGHSI